MDGCFYNLTPCSIDVTLSHSAPESVLAGAVERRQEGAAGLFSRH